MRTYLAVLCLFFVTLPALAHDATEHWFEVQSPHFTVLTDAGDKQARRIAVQFEQMRSVFHTLFPAATADAGAPIVVLALRDRKGFQALEPQAYLAKGQLNLAGLFLRAPDKNYILLRLDGEGDHPFSTVYHEYTHLMMSKAQEWMPVWLNEGLAEFYQNTDIHEKDVVLGQPSTEDILYLRQQSLLPLATLFRVDRSSPYYHEEQKGSVFYAESWALTHYIEMTDREKNTHHLQEYARLVSQHQDPVQAGERAFGDLGQLQKALAYYVQRGSFSAFKMDAVVSVDPASLVVQALPTPDADAVRADVLLYDQRNREAAALLDEVLREDPNNALAHESMGFLKFQEHDIPGALKWYSEAVHLDSHSYLAHYYYAVMALQAGGANHDEEIESSLQTSIKLNPAFAPAYDALATFYGMRHKKLAEAHLLNVQAVTLEPDNLNYRLNTAQVLMQEEQYEGAIGVLKTAVRVAKTPQDIALVQDHLQIAEQLKASMEHAEARSKGGESSKAIADASSRVIPVTAAMPAPGPQHPTEEPSGARHTARGVLRSVQCAYPTILTLELDESGKRVLLYRNDLFKIDFTTTNFTPDKDIDACGGIEGMKAKVEYAEVSDKSVAGQILSIELTK